jgi:hypothetical protein
MDEKYQWIDDEINSLKEKFLEDTANLDKLIRD